MRVKTVAAVLVPVLVAAGAVALVGGPEGVSGARPDWLAALEAAPGRADAVPWRGSSSAPVTSRSVPGKPAAFEFPAPARWDVRLAVADDRARNERGGGNQTGSAAAPDDGRPVRLAARGTAAVGGSARVEVLDRAAASRVDASGFAFTVSTASGASAIDHRPAGRVPVTMTVDYSRFAKAYGASFADRLRLVALAPCALAEPVPAGCRPTRTVLAARNDRAAGTLTAAVDVAGVAAFVVASVAGGEEGSFTATPLSINGSWQVSPGSGEFGYSYPISVPAPAGGSAPSVALGYSSGAIDGLTMGSNTQAGPTGLGWSDFAGAFIERRYEPCIHADAPTTDLCWKSDNATISLNGISGPLIPANATNTQWRVMSDPGWRVERLTGAPHTGIYQQQYWKVIGPDGTQYWFGSGQMPGQQTFATLGVPVWADNVGEPCRASASQAGSCLQGWRWYLDRVVDPDGNMTNYVYEREENWYAGLLGIGGNVGNTRYHRAAMLKHIYYGGQGWNVDQYAGHVEFGLRWRCIFLTPNCPEPVKKSTGFPDVPTDLICAQNQACTVYAPSFFNTRHYVWVRTQVKVGAGWKDVAQYNLYHRFFENTSGVAEKLQLDSVVYAAIAFDKLNAYPPTTFSYTWKNNRVDHDGIVSRAMRHNRLTKVTNPFGGTTTITYDNRACPQNYLVVRHPHWDENVLDCFPQRVKDGTFTGTGVFHKYLVTRVVESAGQGSPDMVTTYAYGGDPAWAYDTGAFARDEDEYGWAIWRGYDTVTITQGATKSRLRLFRGWDNDWLLEQVGGGDLVPVPGRRHPPLTTFDGSSTYVDDVALSGRVLEEQGLGALGGVADSVLESRRHEYVKRDTATPSGFLIKAEWAGLATTTERVYSTPGTFRERRSRTTYTAGTQPQPTTTLEEGWLDVTGDERCSITTYADNTTAGMVVYPAVNKKVAGACTSTDVLTLTETYYDGGTTLGGAPTRGNPTRQRALIENGRWSESTTEFDAFGRPVRVTDPTGAVSTTAYGVTAGAWAGQVPIRRTDTNAVGHQTVTQIIPEFGVVAKATDANGNLTEFSYDEFGRMVAVWLPDAPIAFAEPSWRFAYDIPNRAIHTRRLTSDARCCEDAVFEDTWVVHDGFWRPRQTQGRSPVSGKVLVTETTYDDRGALRDETVEQALTGTGGLYIPGGGAWLNRTRHAYDELGRQVRTEWLRGTTPLHATTTAYGVDTVTVTGPDGRQVRERTDGLGRTVAAEEFDGTAWVTSRYTYDLADRLLTVTDPAGNRYSYTVNRAGWRTAQQDPDRGNATFTFDNAARQLSATDAASRAVHTAYDALGRPVERRSGSATGPLLASWQYDTASGGKGRPHRETTHTATGNWVSEVLGYDLKGRVTGSRLTVPAGIAGLSGSYTTTQTYDRADRVRTVSLPAIGGLPAETVTNTFNTLGLPTRLTGIDEYVWNVVYDDRGRRTSAGLGPRPGGSTWMARTWTHDLDQRVNAVETFVAGAGVVSRHDLAFDPAGNLTENLTRQGGLSWRECFGYDPRSRLRTAHTVAATASCAGGTPGTGDRPYAHEYTYSADGRMTARTENGVPTAYTYPAAGAARPHAPTRVGADTYTWDASGSLASRTVGGRTETFTWDAQHRLSSVTGPTGATSFVYDANGQRLLRRTPDGRATLYVAGHEVTANASGSIASAVRPYTFDGQLIATRTLTGVEYLVSDAAGSIEVAAPAGGAATSASRSYEPYGQVRAQTGDTATDRGFLGQVEDSSTNLSYLNARYYDAAAGVFISADPVYNPSKPKTINPYAYSVSNPTTYSDPGGAYSSHTFALEQANAALTAQVRKLIGHIKQLNSAIAELQDFVREQQSYIKDLLTYIDALEAEIARQQSIIRRLQAHIAALQREVWALRAENSRLRAHIARQNAVIGYYKGIVNVLGFRLWGGTPHFERVMFSIHSFRGIPAWAFAVDNISILQAQVADLSRRMGGLRAARDSLSDSTSEQRARAVSAEANVDRLEGMLEGALNGQAALRNRMRELEIRVELGDFAYEIYLEGPQESPYKSCSFIEQVLYWGVDQVSSPHAPGSAPGSPSALDTFCTEPAPIPAA